MSVKSLSLALMVPFLFVFLADAAEYNTSGEFKLPDLQATPGASRALSKAKICTIKWGKDERHVTQKMKRDVCEAYGAPNCPSKDYEIDHLISRELGGDDVETNLWPQPITEARIKDRVENWLHKQLCAGNMTLDEIRQGIVEDWTQYLDYLPPSKPK